MRVGVVVALGSLLLLGACGGDGAGRGPRPTSTVVASPGAAVRLQPLEAGRDVLAPDGWYTLRIPLDWTQADSPISETAVQSPAGDDRLTLNVSREELDGITQPQAYLESTRRQINLLYRNVLPISMAPVMVGDVSAYRWMYTATVSGQQRLIYQVFIVNQGTGLVLTGLAPSNASYDETRETFDAIVGTLRFGRG